MSPRRKTGVISCCRGPNRLWTKLISSTFSCNAKRENSQYSPWNSRKTLAMTILSLLLALILKQHQTIRVHGAHKTSSSVVASHKGDHLFFVMTAKRHQEFSTNFSTEDSRIISENIHLFLEGFYNNRIWFLFSFLNALMWDYNYSIIKWYRKNWIDRENVENDVK